jgi:hypothetical protein
MDKALRGGDVQVKPGTTTTPYDYPSYVAPAPRRGKACGMSKSTLLLYGFIGILIFCPCTAQNVQQIVPGPVPGGALISFDSAHDLGSNNTSSYTTSSFSVASNATFLEIASENNGSSSAFTAITCGGVSLTKGTTQGAAHVVTAWYLESPPTGSITCTMTGPGGTTATFVELTLIGAKTSGQPEVTNNGTSTGGNTSPATISVTTLANNDWLISSWSAVNGSPGCNSSGVTCTTHNITAGNGNVSMSTYGPFTPAGSSSMLISSGGAGTGDTLNWVLSAIAHQ